MAVVYLTEVLRSLREISSKNAYKKTKNIHSLQKWGNQERRGSAEEDIFKSSSSWPLLSEG